MTDTDLTPEGQKQAEIQQAARTYATRLKLQIAVFFTAIIGAVVYDVVADDNSLFLPIILAAALISGAFQVWSTLRFNAEKKEIEARYGSN